MPLLREHATGALAPASAARLAGVLRGIPNPATVTLALDAQTLDLPPEAVSAVVDLLQRFADGQAVVVGSTDSLLTTSQAAELVGVSATYLLRLANEGVIAVEYRGTHRRFRLADALAYLETSRRAKAEKAAAAAKPAGADAEPS
ncbi:helix-turn-helix domain-containing protein [Subtercola vilae]|uniref:DNA-binding protein n=1 Tax=Subtercola vilae TaxID=2056433 RepID=A0A4T2C910_9MICO|nr:helix-turn-helix domain-containing protein [Subtercola vilae]TIH40953.1 DNA-binding protein [Subtercola vilae]